MVHLSHLPTEILFNIFFLFTPAESWPILSLVSSWSDFLIKKCWEKTKSLNLEDFPLIRTKSFQSLIQNFRDLKTVQLNCVYLSCMDIQRLPIGIESLKIYNVDKILKGKVSIFSVLSRFGSLKVLKICALESREFKVDFGVVSKYFRECELKTLEMQKVHLVETRVGRVLEYPIGLKVLKVLNSVSDQFPENLVKLQIWKLKSQRFLGLNHETLLKVAERCRNLESMSIVDCTRDSISNESFHVLVTSCKSLKKIKLSRQRNLPIKTVNDFSAMLLSTQTNQLISLNLDSFQKISDAGIIEILKTNPKISNLSLSYTFISDDSLLAISNLKLQKLALRSCKRITSAGLCKLFVCLPNLIYLNLAHAHGINDEVLETIEFNCKNIEKLVIRQPDLSENFVFNLNKFEKIASLSLDFCCFSNFLLSGIRNKLEELSIVACKGLDDSGLSKICEEFWELKKLNIKLCNGVSEIGVVEVCKKMKCLRFLDLRGLRLSTGFMGYLPLMWKNLLLVKMGQLRMCEEKHQEEIKGKFKVLVEMDGESSYLKFLP